MKFELEEFVVEGLWFPLGLTIAFLLSSSLTLASK